jgi:hypothetical protein
VDVFVVLKSCWSLPDLEERERRMENLLNLEVTASVFRDPELTENLPSLLEANWNSE